MGNNIKINITDIMSIIIIAFLFFFKSKTFYNGYKNTKILIWFYALVILLTLYMPIGLLNGADFGNCMRVLRNWILVILSCIFTYSFYNNKSDNQKERDFFIFCWIVIISNIINVYIGYTSFDWYQNYRANANFLIFAFCFLLFYRPYSHKKILFSLLRISTMVLLVTCSLFSQERLQLISIIIAIFITAISWSLKNLKINLNIRISVKKILLFFVSIIFFCVTLKYLLSIEFVKSYVNYYVKYRVGAVFTGNSIHSDESLNVRYNELINILFNSDIFGVLFGNGLCSNYKFLNGSNYIVDSAWLWILKDTGLLGICFLFASYCKIFNKIKLVIVNKKAIFSGVAAVTTLMVFIPDIMISINDAFAFGYILGLIELMVHFPKKENVEIS